MSKRSDDGRFPSDEFDLQLENQSGEKLTFNSETDRRFFSCFLFTLYHAVFTSVDREVPWFLLAFCKNALPPAGHGMAAQCCGRGP